MGDFYGFLLCLITILGFLGLKGWKYWLLALAMAHGCSFCSFSPISPGERTGRFGTQVPRSIGWYLSSSEEVPVVRCHRTLWDGDGSGIAFIIGIHRMCTPTGGNLDGRWWTRMIIVSPLNCNRCNLWAIPGQLYLCKPLTHLWCNGRIPKTGRLRYYKGQIFFGISQILCETAHAASNHHQKTHRNWVLMYILHLSTIYNWITKKSPPHSKNLQLQHPSLPRHQRSLASLASFAQSLLSGSHFRPWCSGV